MNQQLPYTYTVLRYVHDIRTGEFLNAGIVLHVPAAGRLLFQTRRKYQRIKAAFPDLNGDVFRGTMASVDRALADVAGSGDAVTASGSDAATLARRALPQDDSALQWAGLGSGLTNDPERTLTRLYDRLVGQYDADARHRRSDADVWRPVRDRLQQRAIPIVLEEKTVIGSTDEIAFKHAWKNGHWHVYEPLSLDLADADGIKDKARLWRGHLAAVAKGGLEEPLTLHFIVGAPDNQALLPAYRSALAILRESELHPLVFEDDQIEELVNVIEDEVRAHRKSTVANG